MSLSRLNSFVPYLPGPKTGISNPKCYAARLMNCSTEMSGEHYISHGLLRGLSEDGVTIEIEGFPWLQDEERKKFPTKSLRSNILCKRHNQALAGLDTVAKSFFLSIDEIDRSYATVHQRDEDMIFLFNGHDVERWMLKTLCGLAYSGISSSQSGRIEAWRPNYQWLQILFGEDRFRSGWGLYVLGSTHHVSVINRTFQCAPISNDSVGIYGSITILNDKKFVLAMMRPPPNREGTTLAGCVYRPNELVMTSEKQKKAIRLSWDLPGEGGSIIIQYSP
jgi:hypothetical protein